MAGIQIALLGGLEIRMADGQAIAFSSRKTALILAILAASPGRQATRDQLINLLWSTRDEAQARASLRQSLFSLRQMLADHDNDAVDAGRETIALSSASVTTDLWQLEAAETGNDLHQLETAAALYRGPLLAGIASPDPGFDDWLSEMRRHAADRAASVYGQLAARQSGAGKFHEAVRTAEALVQLDSLRESSHRLLMSAHVAAGERALALVQYKTCRDILRRELGVEPSAATEALCAELAAENLNGTKAEVKSALHLDHLFTAPAVAILPFANLSGDPAQEYFSDGVTEDIITALSYWRWFPVIGRHSTARYRGKNRDIVEIGKAIGARYLVEGGVQRAGERLRITAHLIDAENGHQVWSRKYDRTAGDVFAVQDELVGEIARAIEPSIAQAEQHRARTRHAGDLNAWERSQLALWHIRRATKDDYATARKLLEDIVEGAPAYGYPRSLLAFCQFYEALYDWTSNPAAALDSVLKTSGEAVATDGTDWLALALHGIAILWTSRRHDLSKEALSKALALNPSASTAHHFYGCTCGFAGDFDEAFKSQEAVLRLDPNYFSISVIHADVALQNLLIGKLDEAVRHGQLALDRQPGNVRALQRLAASYGLRGDLELATKTRLNLLRLQPKFSLAYIDTTYPFADAAHREIFLDGLRRAGFLF